MLKSFRSSSHLEQFGGIAMALDLTLGQVVFLAKVVNKFVAESEPGELSSEWLMLFESLTEAAQDLQGGDWADYNG